MPAPMGTMDFALLPACPLQHYPVPVLLLRQPGCFPVSVAVCLCRGKQPPLARAGVWARSSEG